MKINLFLKQAKLLIVILIVFGLCKTGNASEYDVSQDIDTSRVNNYIKIAAEYLNVKPDTSKYYIDSLHELSKQYDYKYGLFKSYHYLGNYYWIYANYDSSLFYYKKALYAAQFTSSKRNKALILGNIGMLYSNLFNTDSAIYYLEKTVNYSLECNSVDLANKANFDLGRLYLNQGRYFEAIKHLMQAKDSLVKYPNANLEVLVYSIFGSIYYHMKDFDNSLSYYNKAIDLDNKNDDTYILPNILAFKGQLYFELGHNLDSAVYYYKYAQKVAHDYNKEFININVNIGLGNVIREKENYDSSSYYYFKVIESPVIKNNLGLKAAALVNIGSNYLKIADHKNAERYLNRGLKLAESLGIFNYQQIAYENLIELADATGDYKKSVEYYKLYNIISDSIHREEAHQQLEKYKFNKYLADQTFNINYLEKENELKTRLLYNRNILIILLLLGAVSLFIYLISIYINRRKIRRLAAELEKRNQDLNKVNLKLNNLNEEQNVLNEELNSANENLIEKQNELLEANQTKDKFFTIIGHDLKSPFNSLLGFLDLLNNDWDSLDDPEKKDVIDKLHKSTEVTYTLLEDLLDWSKTQRGLIKPNIELFRVKPRLDEIFKTIKRQLNQKDITFDFIIDDKFELNTDSQLFSQIMLNLVANAVKFTPVGGKVSVIAENINGGKQICVSDTGIGFPKDKVKDVFNFDFDFNRTGTNNEKSSGMGLILCSEYSKIIGAQLKLESKENEGSTFCLFLKND